MVRETMKMLPGYRILYFGDTARAPYGNKSREAVVRYAAEDAKFLADNGAKLIVVGCNTASAFALEALKDKFPEVPVFGVIDSAARKAAGYKRVGVIGTRGTVSSGVYESKIKRLNPSTEVFSRACPLFVPLVEEGWTGRPEAKTIARKYLQLLKMKSLDALVMGCTHYPFMEGIIREKIGRKVKIINSGKEAVSELKEFLENNPEIEKGLEKGNNHKFFVSDLAPHLSQMASRWLEMPADIRQADIS